MEVVGQGRLYRLAKRLSIERLLVTSRFGPAMSGGGCKVPWSPLRWEPATDIAGQAAALGRADLATAERMAVASWFPRDVANARLKGQ
jgi:hypothetical protein